MSRPRIRVNQTGYRPGRPMGATMITEAEQAMPVELRDAAGTVVWRGWSHHRPVEPEPSSGLPVHVIDFTGAVALGPRFSLHSGPLSSHSFPIGPAADAGALAADALQFFRLMRSGAPGPDHPAGYGHPPGHLGVPPNTGDTSVRAWTGPDAERLYPGWDCPGVFDVSGGWYDAGDYGKYVTSGSIAVWQLMSIMDTPWAPHGPWAELLVAECRWQLDWLGRMQVPAGVPLAGMAFHRVHGTAWSPLPGRADQDPTTRVLHRPSTPATLQLAAVTAHAARVLGPIDPAYAAELLEVARRAYAAAADHPDLAAPDDHARHGGGPYPDDDPSDDAYWAAVELWLTTDEDRYRQDLERSPWHRAGTIPTDGFDGDRVGGVARLDLARHADRLTDGDAVRADVVETAERLVELAGDQPWGQPYAPDEGWHWGSNGRLLNNLVVLAVAWDLTGRTEFRDAVGVGTDYLLGRNGLGQSYVTGYGTDATHHQRTRAFGHDLDPALPPPPPGALAGGACSRPSPDFPYDDRLVGLAPQLCYLDEPTSEVTNDVCIRWNAPLVYVAAFLDRT